jgi:hypothetical protein
VMPTVLGSLPATSLVGCLTLIPDGLWTTTIAGISPLASTAVVSKVLTECYDGTKCTRATNLWMRRLC